MIQINAESTGNRAALLLELERARKDLKRLQLRIDQIQIMLRDQNYRGEDLFKRTEDKDRS